jgi:chaperonin cofactor prefoldin
MNIRERNYLLRVKDLVDGVSTGPAEDVKSAEIILKYEITYVLLSSLLGKRAAQDYKTMFAQGTTMELEESLEAARATKNQNLVDDNTAINAVVNKAREETQAFYQAKIRALATERDALDRSLDSALDQYDVHKEMYENKLAAMRSQYDELKTQFDATKENHKQAVNREHKDAASYWRDHMELLDRPYEPESENEKLNLLIVHLSKHYGLSYVIGDEKMNETQLMLMQYIVDCVRQDIPPTHPTVKLVRSLIKGDDIGEGNG